MRGAEIIIKQRKRKHTKFLQWANKIIAHGYKIRLMDPNVVKHWPGGGREKRPSNQGEFHEMRAMTFSRRRISLMAICVSKAASFVGLESRVWPHGTLQGLVECIENQIGWVAESQLGGCQSRSRLSRKLVINDLSLHWNFELSRRLMVLLSSNKDADRNAQVIDKSANCFSSLSLLSEALWPFHLPREEWRLFVSDTKRSSEMRKNWMWRWLKLPRAHL